MSVLLHVRSHWSFGAGVASPAALAAAAHAGGHRALLLADVETMAGLPEHERHCRELGLQPLFGVELRAGRGRRTTGSRAGRLLLVARDARGWSQLCQLQSRRRLTPGPTPSPLLALRHGAEGVIVASDDACVLAQVLEQGLAPPRDCVLLALADAAPADIARQQRAAAALGVPLCAAAEASLLRDGDRELQALRAAVQQHRLVGDAELEPPRWLQPLPALAAHFAEAPAALQQASALAAGCSLGLGQPPRPFPSPPLHGREPIVELARLLRARLAALPSASAAHDRRLERELAAIAALGFAGCFLALASIAAFAQQRRIGCLVRGSAASALASHLLGLTAVDPVQHGLLFERFLDPLRQAPPDVDLDIASERRAEVLAHLADLYGREQVAMVAAHHTFGRRSAWRAALRALGAPPRRIEKLLQQLPPDELGDDEVPPLPSELRAELQAPELRVAERLIGMPQHLAAHPGGIVVGAERLATELPLERTSSGVVVTQFDLHGVGHCGFVKLDVLGNRALDEIEAVARVVGPTAAALDDAPTLQALRRADTIGCFQLESPAMRSLLQQLPLHSFAELVDALALLRPGAAAGAAKVAFVRRANGEAAAPAHPSCLAATHGVLLYDEQLLCLVAEALDCRLGEAERWRTAVQQAGDDAAAMAVLGERFAALGGDRSAWRLLRQFAAYAFCKAHAAAYASLAWTTLFLKTHHPAAFGCALLNHHGGLYPLRTLAAEVARTTPLRLPDVECSAAACMLEDGGIRIGLQAIKHLGNAARAALLAARPFASLADLLRRVQLAPRELEALVLSGACDRLPPLQGAPYPDAHERLLAALARGPQTAEAIAAACAEASAVRVHSHAGEVVLERYQRLSRVQNELRLLSMHVSDHPLRLLRARAAALGCITTAALRAHAGGGEVALVAILAALRRLRARDGRVMAFATLEDEHGLAEAVLLPPVFARHGQLVTTPGPYLLVGTAVRERRAVQLEVRQLQPFGPGAPGSD